MYCVIIFGNSLRVCRGDYGSVVVCLLGLRFVFGFNGLFSVILDWLVYAELLGFV